ncbi:hypothetical protein DPMN_099767 [Dreissena polymorpha]|uniref:Uncharacterized protein n=1 Tax=Dreissena polymorpha TaxID=45954 RepID=A0A9D4LEI0_DREPO|nr:hypothetical protein DPMN_099767 [Dreissena polymorpha]
MGKLDTAIKGGVYSQFYELTMLSVVFVIAGLAVVGTTAQPAAKIRTLDVIRLRLMHGTNCTSFCHCATLATHADGTVTYYWARQNCGPGTQFDSSIGPALTSLFGKSLEYRAGANVEPALTSPFGNSPEYRAGANVEHKSRISSWGEYRASFDTSPEY